MNNRYFYRAPVSAFTDGAPVDVLEGTEVFEGVFEAFVVGITEGPLAGGREEAGLVLGDTDTDALIGATDGVLVVEKTAVGAAEGRLEGDREVVDTAFDGAEVARGTTAGTLLGLVEGFLVGGTLDFVEGFLVGGTLDFVGALVGGTLELVGALVGGTLELVGALVGELVGALAGAEVGLYKYAPVVPLWLHALGEGW